MFVYRIAMAQIATIPRDLREKSANSRSLTTRPPHLRRTILGETPVTSYAPAELLTANRQMSLGGNQPTEIDPVVRAHRVELSAGCWIDHRIGWVRGADILFEQMLASVKFVAYTRPMYDRIVAVPRLSWFGSVGDPELPTPVPMLAAALEADFGQPFQSLGANLYRTGVDSVAWHSDRIGRRVKDPLVALVSLGEHRPFLLRPKCGGPSRRFMLGGGDLLVMGGATQHRWDHAVPKVRRAGPRLSLGFRDPAGLPD